MVLLGLIASGHSKVAGVHAGLIALLINAAVAVVISKLPLRERVRTRGGTGP